MFLVICSPLQMLMSTLNVQIFASCLVSTLMVFDFNVCYLVVGSCHAVVFGCLIYYRACNGIQHKAASSVPIKSPASGQVSKALKEPSLSSGRPPLMLFAEMSPALESEIANMGFAGETIFYLLIFFTA